MVARDQIKNATSTAIQGSRIVKITFGAKNLADVIYLFVFERLKMIDLGMGGLALAVAAIQSYEYNSDRNFTLMIFLSPTFNMGEPTEVFFNRMAHAIDTIEVV